MRLIDKYLINKLFLLITISVIMFGCSTKSKHKSDPFEPYNRVMYGINKGVDIVFIKPIASAYVNITPPPLRRGLKNVFANLAEPTVMVNDLLQFNILEGISDLWRFAINSTLGLAGLFDVASHMGLKKRYQDFGLTLAKWGDEDPPYFVLPLFGSSTLRDAASFIVDNAVFSIYPRLPHIPTRNIAYVGSIVNARANLLESDKVAEEAAIEPYISERDAYLQRRKSLHRKNINGDNGLGEDILIE